MRRERTGNLYLLTGVALGFILGLSYAWFWQPVEYIDTEPISLRSDMKDYYRALIATSYLANGDLVRAQARLKLLGDSDTYRTLAEQAQRTLAQGGSPEEARALGLLAVALNPQNSPTPGEAPAASPSASSAPPSATPTPTQTADASSTPLVSSTLPISTTQSSRATQETSPAATEIILPTRTPSPTPAPPFVLKSMDALCDQDYAAPLLAVETLDGAGKPVSGVEIIISWDGGEEHFFTGLKPELGLGYADFTLQAETLYSLRLPAGGLPVNDIQAVDTCGNAAGSTWGAWLLVFARP